MGRRHKQVMMIAKTKDNERLRVQTNKKDVDVEDWKLDGEYVYRGVLFAYMTPLTLLEKVRDFEVWNDDCFVVSYPKTGTTWMQEIVYLLYHNGDIERAMKRPVWQRVPMLEYINGFPYISNLVGPRILKTHLPFDMIPCQVQKKGTTVIYVMRNPKDTLVSYYHFYRSTSSFGYYTGSWSDFFQLFLKDQLLYGNFFDHVLGWWEQRLRPNIHFVKYENLIKDRRGEIVKIARFLGKVCSEDVLDRITDHTSFQRMRQNPSTNYANVPNMDPSISPFIRKGTVGDWKNYFSKEQNEVFNLIYKERMAGSGLEFEFEL